MSTDQRITKALEIATEYGGIDGDHHKTWAIDQIVRALTGCPIVTKAGTDCNGHPYEYDTQGESAEYQRWVSGYEAGEDGPYTYSWDEGIAP